MLVRQSALDVCDVRLFYRRVGSELEGCPTDESTCRHDDLLRVPGHIPRLGHDVGVDRRDGLYDTAKLDEFLFTVKYDGSNDVPEARSLLGNGSITHFLEYRSEQYASFQRAGNDVRRLE